MTRTMFHSPSIRPSEGAGTKLADKDRKMTTLALVDDDEHIVASLKMFFEAEGYTVRTYHDGEAALPALTESPPDIAILDVKLRDGEIYPLADRLRELGVPMIFHSAHVNERDIVQRYPSARVCCKPFDASLLRQVIDDVVASRSSPRK